MEGIMPTFNTRYRQAYKTPSKKMKTTLLLIGISLLVLGLLLTLAIFLYSLKEKDNGGFYYLILSLGFVVPGTYCLVKSNKTK